VIGPDRRGVEVRHLIRRDPVIRKPREQLLEGNLRFQSSQGGSHAVVDATAEFDVLWAFAMDIKTGRRQRRSADHGRRGKKQQHLLARSDRSPAHLNLGGCRSAQRRSGSFEPQHLIDGRRQ
jgi:hypothetical protein